MDATTAAGLASLATAVLGGVAGLLVIILRSRQQAARRNDKNSQDIINRQEKRIERLEQQVDEYQSAFEAMATRESRCRVRLAEIYGHLQLQSDLNHRLAAIVKDRLGLDLGPLPVIPPPESGEDAQHEQEADFVLRTLRQSAKLVGVANKIDAVGGPGLVTPGGATTP